MNFAEVLGWILIFGIGIGVPAFGVVVILCALLDRQVARAVLYLQICYWMATRKSDRVEIETWLQNNGHSAIGRWKRINGESNE